ncbi:hypothetical protein GGX14DRAFT_699035 [Mycena pura]|uniref:DUF6534 domain-containing protein n=1 Tax=Mycena pura TaxID=153505 RepID=A0AAD6V7I8_9AGAR|nr:hypothetical protein GGX14DRAFT_699035 [Mycena pura]
MAQNKDVQSTIGALLTGCLFSVGLSAVLGFQTFLYFRIFPMDSLKYKILVAWIWLFDATHTILICTSVWQYVVINFNNPDFVAEIVPLITVAVTAITTLIVNIFYGWRLHRMSNGNWILTGLISILLLARIGLAFVTTVEMILTRTFINFAAHFSAVFTAGLSVSAATDIVVSFARYYYVRNLQQGYPSTQEMVDAVVIFTINDGCLICAVIIAAITCLLCMPDNLIYLGIYFTIAKLYSNSVLATLNLRNWYRHQRPMGIPLTLTHQHQPAFRNTAITVGPVSTNTARGSPEPSPSKELEGMPSTMEVFVNQQVEYSVAVGPRVDSEDTRTRLSRISSAI